MDVRIGMCELRRGRHMIEGESWKSEGGVRSRESRGCRRRKPGRNGGGDSAVAIEGYEGENGRCGEASDCAGAISKKLDCR